MSYRSCLEIEYTNLRSRRVELRRALRWFASGRMLGNGENTVAAAEEVQRQLRMTEPRWSELSFLLQKQQAQPVSVRLTAQDRALLARQAARKASTQRRAVPSYITKVITTERPGR
jgi:hypothetical protein